jgi:L-ascorbate metabolism protein UlaG (beta-lactamase superfamily)
MRITSFGHAAVLVETGEERILVDPWLTHRLDRFWEHWPALPDGLLEVLDEGVDHVIFSHHHFDHHHFPSLRRLTAAGEADFDEAAAWGERMHCVWPRGEGIPRFTASGLGHQTMGWTLRRLGFTDFDGVRPGDTFHLGRTKVRSFASRVPFPEMSLLIEGPDATVMLCGDAMLHSDTQEFFASPSAPRVDVAFVPAHSVSPAGVLTERRQVADAADTRARATANFDRYVRTLNAQVTVPSSFGWRVSPDDGFGWCNGTIFPFTPWQALQRLGELGRAGLLWGPGQVMSIVDGKVELTEGHWLDKPYDFEPIFAEVQLNASVRVPAFAPGTDRVGQQRDSTGQLAGRLMDHLVGSDFWYRAADSGARHELRVTEDTGAVHDFVLLPGEGRVLRPAGSSGAPATQGDGYTEIAGSTLQALFDGDLLFGSSYGLWTSDSNLLSAVFHHPSFYVRHVEKALAGQPSESDSP